MPGDKDQKKVLEEAQKMLAEQKKAMEDYQKKMANMAELAKLMANVLKAQNELQKEILRNLR